MSDINGADPQNADIQRIKELTALLNDASRAYYQGIVNGDAAGMSDKDYDGLLEELARLEEAAGFALPESPVAKVGYEVVSSLEKVVHQTPMMSLDKTKDPERLRAFLGEREGILSWKLDGLAIELTYTAGRLSGAVTRGSGAVGENVLHSAKQFINIPETIDYTGELRLRGEAMITLRDFEIINEGLEGGARYKNPRNLCSGTIRSLDSAVVRARSVRFVAYSVPEDVELDAGLTHRSQILDFLSHLGFETVTYRLVTAEGFDAAMAFFREGVEGSPYATDGLVLAFDDIEYGRGLGATSKFPRDSLAFKWADEEAETSLIGVEWNTSRTGLINPVALLAPVDIEGTTVERASLHNVSIFQGLCLGEGDRVLVYKANMIIPQISENLTRSGGLTPPESCPVCGGASAVTANNDTAYLYCVNPNCAARAVQTIAHYVSRDAMNIEGLSEQTITKLHEQGMLDTYADLYNLADYGERITEMRGFGETSFNKLINAIESSRTRELHRFIYGLGIDNVGLVYAKELCAHFGGDVEGIIAAGEEELTAMYGFGPVIARSLTQYFENADNVALMRRAMERLTFIKQAPRAEGRFTGKTFVITGDLSGFANRKELQALIEAEGGKVTGSVSKKTDYLINNDAASNSAKNKTARELGVAIITEAAFMELIRA